MPPIGRTSNEDATILEVREEFGGLHISIEGGTDELHAALREARETSFARFARPAETPRSMEGAATRTGP